MPTVNMPRADWETVIMALEDLKRLGYLYGPLIKEIEDQVYSQEY